MKAFKSVAQYIDAQPRAQRAALERVRSTIRKAVPGGEEAISYGIPAYKRHGGCSSEQEWAGHTVCHSTPVRAVTAIF